MPRPPAMVISLELEARPTIQVVCANTGEERRLADWIGSHEQLADLVLRALELADQNPAA